MGGNVVTKLALKICMHITARTFVTTFIANLLPWFGLAPELVPQGETAIWSTLAGRAEISACTLAPSCESFLEKNQELPIATIACLNDFNDS